MEISIRGFNGFPTNATIKAKAGWVIGGLEIVKVNDKSVLLKSIESGHEFKQERLSANYWDIPENDRPFIKKDNGTAQFYPCSKTLAITMLVDAGEYEASLAIGEIAATFEGRLNMRKEPVQDSYGSLSAASIWSMLNKLLN